MLILQQLLDDACICDMGLKKHTPGHYISFMNKSSKKCCISVHHLYLTQQNTATLSLEKAGMDILFKDKMMLKLKNYAFNHVTIKLHQHLENANKFKSI